jgi:hypothetical protein
MRRVRAISVQRAGLFGWNGEKIDVRRRYTMDYRHSRYVGPVDDDQVGQVSRQSGHWIRSKRSGRGRLAVEVFQILAVLALGLVPIDRARAQQDPPAKAEVPKDAVPKEAAPQEALSARYRFTERYSLTDDPAKPELVNEYQVAMRGTYKTVTDKPQGAPERSESSSHLIYTERAAKVTKIGELSDAVRRYTQFRLKSTMQISPAKPPLFEGLTIWYHRRPGEDPQIFSRTKDRPLRELEFGQIALQLFLPQLTAIFPPTPIRVGDDWHIPTQLARYLVSETPDPQNYALDGTLLEVRKATKGTALIAKIGVRGEFDISEKQCAVAADIYFTFEPREAAAAPVGAATSRVKPVEKIVDAPGWVSRVLMTQQSLTPIPQTDGQLRETTTFELDLERRRQPATPNMAGDANNAAFLTQDVPNADEANSWLVYDDPQKTFHFRHPQDLRLEPRNEDSNLLGLTDRHYRGSHLLVFQLLPKEANPERERQLRDPDYHRRTLYSDWEKRQQEVVKGAIGWLPEADWLPLKRKVYRIEAATKPPGAAANAERLYCDYYLVLFNTDQTVVVKAFASEDHLRFRDQAEAVIKSFQFGSSEQQQPPSPAATQTPPPKPPF